MKLAHLADLHLGFRQFYRLAPGGINQREADVAEAFRAAIDGVIAAKPDVVLIAGDLFHAVRPTNFSIVFAYRQFQRLREALPSAPIVVIAGNHETPRTSEVGSILRLYGELGIHLATDAPRRFTFPELDLSVLAVPESALHTMARDELRPEGPQQHQVLLLHGEVEGIIKGSQPAPFTVNRALLADQPWSYVALGHYHVQHEVAPRVWYAGSLEYVSSNIWGELADEARNGTSGKAWLLVDLDSGLIIRQPIPAARTVHDADPIDATDLSAAEVDRLIGERLALVRGGYENAIVRVVIEGIPRHISRDLDHAALRQAQARALHFQLVLHPPGAGQFVSSGAAMRRKTLAELVREKLESHPLPERLSRDRFIAAGEALLSEVDIPDRDELRGVA